MPFNSPKRKRPDNLTTSPVKALPLFTRFPPVPPEDDTEREESPRNQVAGKFQQLNISHYELDQQSEPDGRPTKRAHYSDDEIMESSQDSTNEPITSTPQQTDGPSETHPHPHPHLHPTLQPPTTEAFTFSHAMSTVFPHGQETPRPKSPSLKGGGDGEISDQYWHESEITGHDPDDPDDDGYGINGIGFKPTSAMAYARTQRRKQQIAEYRSREAREARARRSERRRVESGDMGPATPGAPGKRGVRFEGSDGGEVEG